MAVDNGCSIKYAVESLQESGTCDENSWPFREDAIGQKPDDQIYEEARKYTIQDYSNVKLETYKMRACIAQGFPFIFGMKLFKSFGQARNNGGMVPYPDANDTVATEHKSSVLI